MATRTADRRTVDHPQVGRLTLDCDVFTAHGSDLRVVAYTAAAGSEDAAKLDLIRVLGPAPDLPAHLPER